jgi:DNA-binding NtrC family response regulator
MANKRAPSIGLCLPACQTSLDRLRDYTWPGNIRELENFIERAVLLSEGETLIFDSPFNQGLPPENRSSERLSPAFRPWNRWSVTTSPK